MNIRPEVVKSYPPRDSVPARILTEAIGSSSNEYEHRCCIFFSIIFRSLRQQLKKALEQTGGSVNSAISQWNQKMSLETDSRRQYFEHFEKAYNKVGKLTTWKYLTYLHSLGESLQRKVLQMST